VTGLDGSGKSTLVARLAQRLKARLFRLPYHEFVSPLLARSGGGSPFEDVHTDRLLFALDARLANYSICEWRRANIPLVSQRGWMDNFIFGATQGVSYQDTDRLLRTAELERAYAHIYLIAQPDIAFSRIENRERKDKYETVEFMAQQHVQTLRFFESAERHIPILRPFSKIPAILIDTTTQTHDEVYTQATRFLTGLGIGGSLPAAAASADTMA
jgi:thymidylate kinase